MVAVGQVWERCVGNFCVDVLVVSERNDGLYDVICLYSTHEPSFVGYASVWSRTNFKSGEFVTTKLLSGSLLERTR